MDMVGHKEQIFNLARNENMQGGQWDESIHPLGIKKTPGF